jgi:uncharacterized membrane protein
MPSCTGGRQIDVPSPQLIAAFWAKQSALSQVSAFTAFLFFASSMSHFIWSPVDAFDQYLLAITSLVAAIFIIVSLGAWVGSRIIGLGDRFAVAMRHGESLNPIV